MMVTNIKRAAPSVALALSFGMLAACSSGGGSSAADDRSDTNSTKSCPGGQTCGVLDDVQIVVGDTLGGAVGSALPAPLGPVVGCTSDAVNNIVDVPDALLSALETAATTQNPEAIMAALEDMGTSFGNAAFNIQGLLTTLAGDSNAACDEAGSGDSAGGVPGLPSFGGLPGLPGGDGSGEGSDGPTGTPLDLALAPLVDGLDTLVSTLEGAAAGTPAAAAIDPIVEGLDALLAVLNGGAPSLPGLPSGGANPLTDVLEQLQEQLAGLAGGGAGGLPGGIPGLPGLPGGGSGGGADLDLIPLTNVLSDVTDAISIAIGQGRTELQNAAGSEVPVIGGLLLTLESTLADAGVLLDAAGAYNGAATNAAVESLLENTLGNVLTQVIPLEMIGDAAGQDIAGPVRDGIAQGVSALGDGTELLIDPLFEMLLDDAASPVLDPVEGVIAQLLASSPVNLGDTLAGGIAQLTGALGGLTGGAGGLPGLPGVPGVPGIGGGVPTPSLPGLDGGNPLDALLAGLPVPGVGGGLPAGGDAITGTPADLLLAALVANDPTGVLAGLLGPLAGGLDSLLGLLGGLGDLAP